MRPVREHPARVAILNARERWRDPLLTVLTVLLTLIMFVVAPFQAAGVAGAQDIGFAIAVIVIGALVSCLEV
jgi:hypothetical protein